MSSSLEFLGWISEPEARSATDARVRRLWTSQRNLGVCPRSPDFSRCTNESEMEFAKLGGNPDDLRRLSVVTRVPAENAALEGVLACALEAMGAKRPERLTFTKPEPERTPTVLSDAELKRLGLDGAFRDVTGEFSALEIAKHRRGGK